MMDDARLDVGASRRCGDANSDCSLSAGLPGRVTGWCAMARGKSAADSGPVVFSIVDDHPDLCYGVLSRLPQTNSSFAAGVMAATVEEFLALDAAEARRSDVVLLDLRLKDGSALAQNIARLKAAGYPVVIYTGEERPERLLGTLGVGAGAVLCKNETGLLPEALAAVANGDHSWVSPLMASVVLAAPGPRLSPAQMEVLRLYATGVPAQKIASLQGCALETVKSHLRGVKNRYEAHGGIRWAPGLTC
jgi:two-component system, NarL family, nitrate/nitrite response regulator NarL